MDVNFFAESAGMPVGLQGTASGVPQHDHLVLCGDTMVEPPPDSSQIEHDLAVAVAVAVVDSKC